MSLGSLMHCSSTQFLMFRTFVQGLCALQVQDELLQSPMLKRYPWQALPGLAQAGARDDVTDVFLLAPWLLAHCLCHRMRTSRSNLKLRNTSIFASVWGIFAVAYASGSFAAMLRM